MLTPPQRLSDEVRCPPIPKMDPIQLDQTQNDRLSQKLALHIALGRADIATSIAQYAR